MKEGTYYSQHRDQVLERVKEYRQNNKEKCYEYYREWYQLNKDRLNAKRNERRQATRVPKVKKEKPVKPTVCIPKIELTLQEPEPVSIITVSDEDFIVKFE
jgi:sortase (surface protein transpeptidase)